MKKFMCLLGLMIAMVSSTPSLADTAIDLRLAPTAINIPFYYYLLHPTMVMLYGFNTVNKAYELEPTYTYINHNAQHVSKSSSVEPQKIVQPVAPVAIQEVVQPMVPACKADVSVEVKTAYKLKPTYTYTNHNTQHLSKSPFSIAREYPVVVPVVPQKIVQPVAPVAIQEVVQPMVPVCKADVLVNAGYNKTLIGGIATCAAVAYCTYIHRKVIGTKLYNFYKQSKNYTANKLQAFKKKFVKNNAL